ncbi:HxlR family transcriptional regulator [Sphingopyxis sp. LC81]|uniref:winged helix-turn-helix transcriptional regulator n=1 Tax=Sphingopyxis sp. LC81 TaxID=1502850 RepID=UPI00050F3D7C|nr:helix-turn-helix domain-containing protein [Sphingopyxis sp. LC81]KGB53063.1 HxlR family transcriptional regulator [Sphingopyxis sp. LC81]
MAWSNVGDTLCPIAGALAVVGERWTILVLRELFLGGRRFDDLQIQTGMSPHLLSVRLKSLEQEGVIARKLYSERPARYEYRLTEKGLGLYPVLLGLKTWGERWVHNIDDEPALIIRHKACGHEVSLSVSCDGCSQPIGARDAAVTMGSGYAAEREGRRSPTD